jgi:hypothetical protein
VLLGIRPDRSSWRIEPRRVRARRVYEKSSTPLTGFAVDLSVRFSDGGNSAFLEDHNSSRPKDVMRFGTMDDLCTFLTEEIKRNHADQFGQA